MTGIPRQCRSCGGGCGGGYDNKTCRAVVAIQSADRPGMGPIARALLPRNNYAIEQRLRLIDFLLDHYGTINRRALIDYFGISPPQVAADFKRYQELAPDNMVYDASGKRYVRTIGFKRVFP